MLDALDILSSFEDFVLEEQYGKVLRRWVGRYSDKVFGAHLTSDGSLRLFCLLTLLNMPPERLPAVMFFDEPELGLHPHAISLVAEMFKRLSQKRQVFLATQSPYLVDCFELENILVATSDEGETKLRTLPRAKYQEWLDDEYQISDIWLKQEAGGVGMTRSGRTRVCVVCEGPTEQAFVHQCLTPYLGEKGGAVVGSVLSAPSGAHRGGRVTVQRLAAHLRHEYEHFDLVTTVVDFYGFQDRDGRDRAALEADIRAFPKARTRRRSTDR